MVLLRYQQKKERPNLKHASTPYGACISTLRNTVLYPTERAPPPYGTRLSTLQPTALRLTGAKAAKLQIARIISWG